MNKSDFLKLMQRYVANIAISGSTLRNQGAPRVTAIVRDFVSRLDLPVLKTIVPSDYPEQLDIWTDQLLANLPDGAKNWGTARKGLNVFVVQAFLNKHLADAYLLHRLKDVMETPLDSSATARLRTEAGRGKLPRWVGIIGLTQESSDKYQAFASILATRVGVPRSCLDITLWRAER